MSAPINLNKARKARAKAAKKAQADANAVAFGRSKAEKRVTGAENSRFARTLDGKTLETPPNGARPGTEKP